MWGTWVHKQFISTIHDTVAYIPTKLQNIMQLKHTQNERVERGRDSSGK